MSYLLAPKVPLLSAGPYSAEIRVEDAISVAAATWLFASGRAARLPIPPPVKVYLAFVYLNVLSSVVNLSTVGLGAFAFSARLVEYLVWFGVGWSVGTELPRRTAVRALSLVALALVAWGALEAIGVIPQVGRFQGTAGRISLNTGGPYEAATVVLLLALVVRGRLLRTLLVAVLLLTQARVAVAAALAVVLARVRPAPRAVALVPTVLVSALVALQLAQLVPNARLKETPNPVDMASTLIETWSIAPVVGSRAEFVRQTEFDGNLFRYIPGQVDLSFEVRAVRWTTVVKSTAHSPAGLLLGRGPSAWGLGVDGYPIRLFGEVGLLGIALFLGFVWTTGRRYSRGSTARSALIALCVTALFIDIFVSSKCMPLFWCIIAFAEADLREHASVARQGSGRFGQRQ